MPRAVIEGFCSRRGVDGSAGSEDYDERTLQLLSADVMRWLSTAPNVTEGGVSYSLSEDQRAALSSASRQIYLRLLPEGDPDRPTARARYGFAGSLLRR